MSAGSRGSTENWGGGGEGVRKVGAGLRAILLSSAPARGASEPTGSAARGCILGSVVLGSAWNDLTDFLLLGVGRT